MIDLDGKRALVTGGARGIGAAIALALAENGAHVAFTYQRSVEQANAVVESIEATGRRSVAIQGPTARTRTPSNAPCKKPSRGSADSTSSSTMRRSVSTD